MLQNPNDEKAKAQPGVLEPKVPRHAGSLAEKVRFVLVGGFNTFLGFGTFALIQLIWGEHINEVLVLLSAHAFASIFAFVLHRNLVFKSNGDLVKEFVRFQSVFVLPLGINLLVLPIAVSGFGVDPLLAQGLFTVISVSVSYFGHKYFSFRAPREKLKNN